MRALIVLVLTTTPALAHPLDAPHLHESDGFWIAAMAAVIGVALSSVAVVRALAEARRGDQ
ncbi:hypothetical protein [Maritimibacter sp. DP1N21-5]|uniref:hypothetical protein n=1 Tax=Maritimibacter sp. DP1N21-5 TaxID=2836867 RepID=UPI001C439E7D|nr:hypothetical protein [Maritimibacter sp. DP1N21-5]MBV7408519.1 hypothetical protein [Maritimibacter sp. DP1N21-5]